MLFAFVVFLLVLWLGFCVEVDVDRITILPPSPPSLPPSLFFLPLPTILSLIAAAVSEPEASERGSSLIGKKLHYRGIQSLFLTKRKQLWLCATQRFGMRNGLARNCG